MRLPAQQVMDAILHPDREIREAAVYYFSRSFSPDPAIMPLLTVTARPGREILGGRWRIEVR